MKSNIPINPDKKSYIEAMGVSNERIDYIIAQVRQMITKSCKHSDVAAMAIDLCRTPNELYVVAGLIENTLDRMSKT
ncbi:TPA_asm: hypothetical protein vir530_00013 [dsDNA virus vir530]|jgi:hypothetical protein|nr:TPA_asm: hypothetical protein vir530_00013 [dsDNA virus vir530]